MKITLSWHIQDFKWQSIRTTIFISCLLKPFSVSGFSPVIPGFPRYSVKGNRQDGIFNLHVTNASLEDDAEYQCQVGPSRFNKAIRANAKLNIICKYL